MTDVKTMCWYEAGPMISFIEGDIDPDKAKEILFSNDEVKELIKELIETETIDDISELDVSAFHIGPMEPEYDGEDALHLDDDGNRFWELCEPDREGAKKGVGISWQDWFV